MSNESKTTSITTSDDIIQLRSVWGLDKYSDEEITKVLDSDEGTVWTGRQWGWNDSIARDNFFANFRDVMKHDPYDDCECHQLHKVASIKLAESQMPNTLENKSLVTSDDLTDLRENYFVSLEGFSDQELTQVLDMNESILWTGRRWGWNDTEARDNFAAALEEIIKHDIEDECSCHPVS